MGALPVSERGSQPILQVEKKKAQLAAETPNPTYHIYKCIYLDMRLFQACDMPWLSRHQAHQ